MIRHALVPSLNAARSRRTAVAIRSIVVWMLAASLLLLPAVPVHAAEAPPVEAGARIRISFAAESGAAEHAGRVEKTIGRLVAIEPGHLTVAVEGRPSPIEVPLDSILRLERSVRRSKRGKGALVGGAIGMAVGFFGMEADSRCDDSTATGCDHTVAGVFAGILLALRCAGIGALVAPGERWADAKRVGLSLSPAGRGVGLRVSVRF